MPISVRTPKTKLENQQAQQILQTESVGFTPLKKPLMESLIEIFLTGLFLVSEKDKQIVNNQY